MSNERAEYAACHLKSLTQVDGEILDSRFMVSFKVFSKGKDCSNIGTAVMQKEFTAIRKMNKSCDPYCPFYLPWADTHDVSVTFSIPTCLDQAIDMDNVIAFRKILELSSEHYSAKIFAGCGTLQRAVERNRTRIVSQILSSPEVNANGSSADQETPLQVAAALGNIHFMQLLVSNKAHVDFESSTGTALFTAALNCQTAAVKFLLEHGSNPNYLYLPDSTAECPVTPLLRLFSTHIRSNECKDEQLNSIITALVDGGAEFSIEPTEKYPNCTMKQTALVKALENEDTLAVEHLLKLNASAKEAGLVTSGTAMTPFNLLFDRSLRSGQSVAYFSKVGEWLQTAGADVDESTKTIYPWSPLIAAAFNCRVDLVEALVKLHANVTKPGGRTKNKTPEGLAKRECEDETQLQKIQELLHSQTE